MIRQRMWIPGNLKLSKLNRVIQQGLGSNDLETELFAGDRFLKDLQYSVQVFNWNLPRR
jgi:hypothetical protein